MARRVVNTYDPKMVRHLFKERKLPKSALPSLGPLGPRAHCPKLGYPHPDIENQTKSYKEREGDRVKEKAIDMVGHMPRVSLKNIRDLPTKSKHNKAHKRNRNRGEVKNGVLDPLGYEIKEGGAKHNVPLLRFAPAENYYGKYAQRRQYPPISLQQIQRMIDMGRLDASRPIDITQICNTRLFKFDVAKQHFGVNITEEGCDIFSAKINLEVQWASELVIAAVEQCGGTITTRYYDPQSCAALFDPLAFFKKGLAIPKCKLPPQDALEYYSDPDKRGYLADPEQILESREKLAQKYGYKLPDYSSDPYKEMLLMRKDPLQIFYGLEPGWIVSLQDELVLKPKDEDYERYFNTVY